jgi:hypothetical protein
MDIPLRAVLYLYSVILMPKNAVCKDRHEKKSRKARSGRLLVMVQGYRNIKESCTSVGSCACVLAFCLPS